MPSIDRDGVAVHYEVTGSGPVVLLTHGFAATSRMFEATARALSDTHTVVTWDLRGHGRSDSPDDPAAYSVPLVIGDMMALLDAAGADRAAVAGHSVGGFLSLELHLAHPERVEALVLIGTGPGYRRDEARDGWNRMAESFARSYADKGLAAMTPSPELDPSAHSGATGLVHAARGILTQRDARVLESLPSIAVPTLVVVGALDEPFLASSRYLADRIPGATLAVIDGAGHAPNVTHAPAFDAALRDFVQRDDVRSASSRPT